jgi:SAM-dependent methyltransferase
MNTTRISRRLDEQLAYYRARAPEYDEWWLRKGRYDRGPEHNAAWFAESAEVAAALEAFRPRGQILELACGTGIWTERLLPFASALTALDGSPEVIALNAARLRSDRVRYITADIFKWKPGTRFNTVFFSFWLSHVPPERFVGFWQLVRRCLAPGGRVFFLDSRPDSTSTAVNSTLPAQRTTMMRRQLNDRREFHVYKVYYDVHELSARLRELGWHFEIRQTPRYFLHGAGTLARRAP